MGVSSGIMCAGAVRVAPSERIIAILRHTAAIATHLFQLIDDGVLIRPVRIDRGVPRCLGNQITVYIPCVDVAVILKRTVRFNSR